jgi:enamine deaminase RidA (YjgF/YER057c/UK114 family)
MVTANVSQSVNAEQRLKELNIQLPAAPTPFGSYVEARSTGNLLFLSGMLPVVDHKPRYLGRLGRELDADAGKAAARLAALGGLAAAKQYLKSLNRICGVVRLGVSLLTSEDFVDHPKVADGASDLLGEVFGVEKLAVRSIIGVASLPLGVPIALDLLFQVRDKSVRNEANSAIS